jgi:hypothetical protein
MTPFVLKPPHPGALSQQASSTATVWFRPAHEGCGFTSWPGQSDFVSFVYVASTSDAPAAWWKSAADNNSAIFFSCAVK